MRLTSTEIAIIKKSLESHTAVCRIFLHGSRIDDHKRGGDIDLFLLVPDSRYQEFSLNKFALVAELSLKLNEQKIDLTILPLSQEKSHPFFTNSQKIEL